MLPPTHDEDAWARLLTERTAELVTAGMGIEKADREARAELAIRYKVRRAWEDAQRGMVAPAMYKGTP